MNHLATPRLPQDSQQHHHEGLINNLEQIQALIKAVSGNIDCLSEAEHFRCLSAVYDLAERAKQHVEPAS